MILPGKRIIDPYTLRTGYITATCYRTDTAYIKWHNGDNDFARFRYIHEHPDSLEFVGLRVRFP